MFSLQLKRRISVSEARSRIWSKLLVLDRYNICYPICVCGGGGGGERDRENEWFLHGVQGDLKSQNYKII